MAASASEGARVLTDVCKEECQGCHTLMRLAQVAERNTSAGGIASDGGEAA